MSSNWVWDIERMHRKYGVHEWVNDATPEQLMEFLKFRISFIHEELNETEKAVSEKNAEEVVDGLIDLCVVAIGTLDAFGVDALKAWNEVQRANMAKEVGIKESRPNPLNLPDLVKPKGWKSPSHATNHGVLDEIFE